VANRTKAAIACANVPEIEVCEGTRSGSAALSDR
jgi:hypothetical protein